MRLESVRKLCGTVPVHLPPLAAVAVFALTDARWLGYALCAVTLGYVALRHRLNGLAQDLAGRLLVVGAGLVDIAGATGLVDVADVAEVADPTTRTAPAVWSGLLVAALIAYEPQLRAALVTGRLRFANLRVRRSRWERLVDPRAAYLLISALTVAFLVAAAALPGRWLPVAVSLLVAGLFFAGTVFAWRHRRRTAYQGDTAVLGAVVDHAPRFVVHFNGIPGADYQLLMWLPYFDRVGDPYLVVLREDQALRRLAAATSAPIVVAPRIADLEYLIVPGIEAAFYVNNGMQNVHCVRLSRLTHVQLMHGDSDKPANYNPIAVMYDRIFVAGQAGIDRYHRHGVDIPTERFRIVGRPQVSDIRVSQRPVSEVTTPVALYAPTWTGFSADVDYCSLPVGEQIVSELLSRGATVIFRAHPYTRRNSATARQVDRLERLLAADRDRTGRAHRWGDAAARDMSLIDCVNAADVMVSDVSGVASDWLYSEKPFAITDIQNQGAAFTETFPLSRAAYVIRHDAGNVADVMDELLRTDPLARVRREVKTYYLSDFLEESYIDGFVNEVENCYGSEQYATFRDRSVSSS